MEMKTAMMRPLAEGREKAVAEAAMASRFGGMKPKSKTNESDPVGPSALHDSEIPGSGAPGHVMPYSMNPEDRDHDHTPSSMSGQPSGSMMGVHWFGHTPGGGAMGHGG